MPTLDDTRTLVPLAAADITPEDLVTVFHSASNTNRKVPASDFGGSGISEEVQTALDLVGPLPKTVAFFGDSITENAGSIASAPYAQNFGNGFATWTRFILKGRIKSLTNSIVFSKDNFGYSGLKTYELRGLGAGNWPARTKAEVLGTTSPLSQMISRISAVGGNVIVVEQSGANDIGLTFTYTGAQIAAARKAMWQEMIACGIPASRIVAVACLPYATGGNGVIQTGLADAANAILTTEAATLGITWVPYPSVFKASSTVDSNYYYDNVHPNTLGSYLLGQAVASALSAKISPLEFELPQASDPAWITPNPYQTGSQSAAITNVTGNISTLWNVPFAGAAGSSYVLSKVTDGEGTWQRVVGTTASRSDGLTLQSTTATPLIAGQYYRMVCKVRSTGWTSINMRLIINLVAKGDVAFVAQTATVNPLDLGTLNGIFVGPVMRVPPGDNAAQVWISLIGSGTAEFTQVGLLRVDDRFESTNDDLTTGGIVSTGSPPTGVDVMLCNATAGAITVNLPAIATVLGQRRTFIKNDATGNAVILDGSGSETVNGATTLTLASQWDRATIMAFASGWVRVD